MHGCVLGELGTAVWAGDKGALVGGGIILVVVFLCFLINVWSHRLFTFLKRINGACPLCHQRPLGAAKKRRTCQCKRCGVQIIWQIDE